MTDEDTRDFVARFLDDVSAVADVPMLGDRESCVDEIGTLLRDALARGGTAWRTLYHRVDAAVCEPQANCDRAAYARLRAFLDENVDLAERALSLVVQR